MHSVSWRHKTTYPRTSPTKRPRRNSVRGLEGGMRNAEVRTSDTYKIAHHTSDTIPFFRHSHPCIPEYAPAAKQREETGYATRCYGSMSEGKKTFSATCTKTLSLFSESNHNPKSSVGANPPMEATPQPNLPQLQFIAIRESRVSFPAFPPPGPTWKNTITDGRETERPSGR